MYLAYLIKRPVAVFMTFGTLLVLGIIAMLRMAVSPLPAVKMPELIITAVRNNVSTTEMENTVARSLREQLSMLQELDEVTSETRDGLTIFKLRFRFSANMEYAYLEANERIDRIMNSLPNGMERPRVNKVNTNDLPLFYINISPRNVLNEQEQWELSAFVRQVVKRRLEQLPEVSLADVTGYREPMVSITPRLSALTTLGISIAQFQEILETNKISANSIASDGVFEYQVHFSESGINTVEQMLNRTFNVQGRILQLRDLADVVMKPQPATGVFLTNGRFGLNVAIIRQGNARTDNVRKQVDVLLEDLRKEYPALIFQQVRDQAIMLDYSISNLWQDLLMGGILAMIVLFLFFRNYRIPLLICITIPVSLLLSLLLFYMFGLSINIISLAGLALGIGLIIDNAVIVIDNINYYFKQQYSLEEACSKGTMDIIRPLLSSGMTTSSVFFPLIFISGIAGALFHEQALAVIISASVSFLVAITLMPVLYYWVHIRTHASKFSESDKALTNVLVKMYEAGFHWVFAHKRLTLTLVLLLLGTGIYVFRILPVEQLPEMKSEELVVHINWGEKIQVEENVHRTNLIREAAVDHLSVFTAELGTQQYINLQGSPLAQGETSVYLKANASAALPVVKDRIKQVLAAQFPAAQYTFSQPATPLEQTFEKSRYNLTVHLKSVYKTGLPDIAVVRQLKQQLVAAFPEVDIAAIPATHAFKLVLKAERLQRYGVNSAVLRDKLQFLLNGTDAGFLDNASMAIPVRLTARQASLDDILQHEKLIIAGGVSVPLQELVTLQPDDGYQSLYGDGAGTSIPININTERPEKIMEKMEEFMKAYPALTVSYSGTWFSNQEMISEMWIIAIITIGLLYFILAAQFESLVQPLIVLLELPVSASGALLLLYVAGASINLMSLIGLIIMSGIIINDSIMKLDTINKLIKEEGYDLATAIHQAGKRRLRAILMTSLITTFSVLPFLFGGDMGAVLQRPLSLVIIGGLTLGTLVSMYFIPLVYYAYYSHFKLNRPLITFQ